MKPRSPLVNRIAIVVGAVVVTALVSMATTLAVSKSIEGNATAINLAGALRMGAFQLLARSAGPAVPESGEDSISQMLDQYETRLADASITKAIPESHDHPLGAQYQAIL
ncbi:MAG: histidine kinase, partial [Gammaproteobacteria bacterium]|nr:histidine kinase [Gammaproteobacteria bacterium]